MEEGILRVGEEDLQVRVAEGVLQAEEGDL